MRKKHLVDISKIDALERLQYYEDYADEIANDIQKLETERNNSERRIMLNEIKEKYRKIKSELNEDLKELSKYETTGIAAGFFEPAITDMLHNSTLLPINHVSFNNLRKLYSSIYEIRYYARYWKNRLEDIEE